MEPPTCTVLVRVVRTTAAVATWLLSPDDEAVLVLLSAAATATPPATNPPTRAPARAAMTTTCLAENSAIGTRPGASARPAVAARHGDHSGARIYLLIETGRGRGVGIHSGRVNFDISRRIRAVNPPGWRAYLLAAQLVDPLDRRTVGVHAGAIEIGLVPGGVGEIGDPVGPHAGDVLQVGRLIRRGG